MENRGNHSAAILGLFIFLGLALLGYLLGSSAIQFKQLERSVTVKGLSEREVPADTVIWPIQFTETSNNLETLYQTLDQHAETIRAFLIRQGLKPEAVSVSPPVIVDKSAQNYGNPVRAEFRYLATQSVTVHSAQVETVRQSMRALSSLGRQGIVFSGGDYQSKPEYLYSGLNAIKPEMIEQATRKAREVALKFAADSQSRLGKIKRATQGQFSISERDRNNPHIKKIRVVSTVEYYLSD